MGGNEGAWSLEKAQVASESVEELKWREAFAWSAEAAFGVVKGFIRVFEELTN